MSSKKTKDMLRASVAEYLTFVTATGESNIQSLYANENVWLSQKMMGLLYGVDVRTINYHLQKIFADNELSEKSVIQDFRITADDGKTYNTKHYNLSAIIAVGYKVNSERAVQFRKWATQIIEEFIAHHKVPSLDDWEIVLDLRPKMESYIKGTEND